MSLKLSLALLSPLLLLIINSRFVKSGLFGDSCECGEEGLGSRIIGGNPAEPHQYPWMAGVFGNNRCGGSLINDRYILTAAHCVSDRVTPRIILGAHTMTELKSLPVHPVEKIIIHPNFRYLLVTTPGDIALIKLARPVKFSKKVSPICLGGEAQNKPDNLFVTGWGLIVPQTRIFGQQLNEASLPPISDFRCKWSNGLILGLTMNPKYQMCVGEVGKSTCQGDSGGPLSTRKGGKVYQLGVVSWGASDCGLRSNRPGVFSRVPGYLDWIKENTKDANYCS